MSARKRKWTKKEALETIKNHQRNFQFVAEEICDELLPLDFHDKETTVEIEKLEQTVNQVRIGLVKLHSLDKQRKFRHDPAELNCTFFNASQHSLFQSSQGSVQKYDSSVETFDSQELLESLPQSTQKEYKKHP